MDKEMQKALEQDAAKLKALTGKDHLFAFDAYVIDMQEEQEQVREFNEYRYHGGGLDFTGWQEQQGRK